MTETSDPAWGSAAAPDDIPEFEVPAGSPVDEGSAGPPDDVPTEPEPPTEPELPPEPEPEPEPEPKLSGSPTADWKNADIEAWAEDNSVDLGGATTKADMLAAIDAAGNKEE